ncbi:hypothetical protein CALCODRAFT_519942 [Calocera cornea HHB12733]|uniref:Uncharacterized protein n=1 Tax=Calocera cornea HHB12733 TaxID=1353952 RepID=A0A165DVZ8_9BASI|nr:hypothetical protein CALCODRAFT_519942 [Calocera cornea HHB12733]
MPLIPSIHVLIQFDGHRLIQSFSRHWHSFKRSFSLDGQVDKTDAEMERALDCVREQVLQDVVDKDEVAELLSELALLGERAARRAQGHSAHNPLRIAQVAHTRHDMREVETEIKLSGAVQKIRRNAAACRIEAEHLILDWEHDKLLIDDVKK